MLLNPIEQQVVLVRTGFGLMEGMQRAGLREERGCFNILLASSGGGELSTAGSLGARSLAVVTY